MRTLRSLAIAAALGVITTSAAYAIPNPYTSPAGGTCGGNEFRTCASLNISWSGTTATVTIQNLGTQGEVFKAFGFANLPAGTTFTAGLNPLPTRFTTGPANEIQGIGFDAIAPAPQNGLKAGEGPFTFSITFGGTFTTANIPGTTFAIHAISGPNGCSTKLEVSGTGVVNDNGAFPNPACGTTVIPEPITMTLLASGLAGMGGVGALRRRRKV